MTVRVTAEADSRQGAGFAVIRVEGLDVAPDGVRFMIRRPGYREDSLGPTGWQAAEALLEPDAVYVTHGVLVMHVGPAVVSQLEPGMNVGFTLVLPNGANFPGRLAWPAIAGPIGGAGARRGRMVATQRSSAEPAPQRTGSALVGDTAPPAPPPVPTPSATARPAASSEPPAMPPPEASASAAKPESAAQTAVETNDAEAKAETEAEAEPEEHAAPAARRAELHAERDPQPVDEQRRRGPWMRRVAVAASIAVLMIAGAAAASVYFGADEICGDDTVGPLVDDWGFCPPIQVAAEEDGGGWNIDPLAWLGPQASEPGSEDAVDRGVNADPAPSPESQRALARQFLATNPTPEEAFARAQELLDDGQVEAAFLIFRYAAERGLADAATQVAAMYDPETYSPESSPLPRPNPTVARIWYERAVAAGDDEALLHLARLLASQEDLEGARAILHQAEEAGLVDAAAQLLEELQ